MSDIIFISHANCNDGFAASWASWRKFGDDARHLYANYGEPPHAADCEHLYLLDFCYESPGLLKLAETCERITVVDHHVTTPDRVRDAKAALGDRLSVVYDTSRSGGALAWDLFCGGEPSWLIRYTEDRDLWKFSLPDSRAVNAWISSWPHDFALWDRWHRDIEGSVADGGFSGLVDEGAAILRCQRQLIERIKRNARRMDVLGHSVLACNTPVFQSEVAGELAVGEPFGACYVDRADGKRSWSLRSDKDGIDVAALARTAGGGGHVRSAGVELPIP